MLRSVAVLTLLSVAPLAIAPAAQAGPAAQPAPEPAPVPVQKKIKAKKLRKTLLGSWRIHPVDEPELTQWISGMASLDRSIDTIVADYRLSNEIAARLEIEKAKSPPPLPEPMQEMLIEGVTVTFTDDGSMLGTFGGETIRGTWTVLDTRNNVLEVNTVPKEGRQDVIVMHWIDKDRVIWSNKDKDGRLRAARVQ